MTDAADRLVRDAYRWILGRAPDADGWAHYRDLIRSGTLDAAGLRALLLASPEFGRSDGGRVLSAMETLLFEPPQPVEVDVAPPILAALVDRVRRQWTRLGETEPHWSVLTDDAYRQANLDAAALKRFHDTGARDAALISTFETRTGREVGRGLCVELGCGTGRVTGRLARRFDRVLALDVSPGNLELCRRSLAEAGVGNVEARLLSSMDQLADLPMHDLFFSTMVLQHNPPPVQAAMLRAILPWSQAALFQTPASLPGYAYSAGDHLASAEGDMDMHCLPRPVVLAEIAAAGLTARDVCPDHFTGVPGSFTYFATRG